MTFKLHIWVSRFLVWKPFFWAFFFHLVLILGFQARLMLETCRKYCLEQNPVFFLAHSKTNPFSFLLPAHWPYLYTLLCLLASVFNIPCSFTY